MASAADRAVLTRAPAACSTSATRRQGVRLVIDREHVDAAQIRDSASSCARIRRGCTRGTIVAHRMDDHQRNLHAKRGALVDSAARRIDRAAVHLDELPGYRQPQAEPAAFTGDAGVRLAEPLEHMRKEFRRDADAGIADGNFHVRIDAFEADLHPAAAVRELDRIRQQIPQHLLQALRIARDGRRIRIEHGLDAYALGLGGRRNAVDCAAGRCPGKSTGWTFSRILPETIREMSRTSSTICVSDVAFRSIVSMALSFLSGPTIPERSMRA